MILAVVLAVGVMLIFAGRVSAFVEKHPHAENAGPRVSDPDRRDAGGRSDRQADRQGLPLLRAMGFALGVEFLNLRIRSLRHKRAVHEALSEEGDQSPRPATSEAEF